MKNKTILVGLLGILLLTSCAGIAISPKGCKSNGVVANKDDYLNRMIEKDYWVFFMSQDIYLKDLIDCKKTNLVKLKIENNYLFHYIVHVDFKEESSSTVGL